jgi:hypothetical protein
MKTICDKKGKQQMNEINWMQQGWECPKCGAVMAPHVSCCINCRGNKGGSTVTTTTSPMTTKSNWTGDDLLTTPSSTRGSQEDAESQWERYYLNV